MYQPVLLEEGLLDIHTYFESEEMVMFDKELKNMGYIFFREKPYFLNDNHNKEIENCFTYEVNNSFFKLNNIAIDPNKKYVSNNENIIFDCKNYIDELDYDIFDNLTIIDEQPLNFFGESLGEHLLYSNNLKPKKNVIYIVEDESESANFLMGLYFQYKGNTKEAESYIKSISKNHSVTVISIYDQYLRRKDVFIDNLILSYILLLIILVYSLIFLFKPQD